MGWENPEIPWRELERRLSGRPQTPSAADGCTATAATPRPGRASARPTTPAPLPRPSSAVAYGELHAHSSFSFLDGASAPEELAEEAVRLGLRVADPHRSRRRLRHRPLRRGGRRRYGLATGFGAELSLDVALPSTQAERDDRRPRRRPRPARHAPARAGPRPRRLRPRCRARSARRTCAAARRAARSTTTSTSSPPQADGHWLVLTGCRKGAVRRALDRGGAPAPPARRSLGLVELFGRDNVVVELTYELDPLADERYDALAALADELRLDLVATTAAHYHGPPRRPLATALAAVRARSSLDDIDGWLPAGPGQHLRSGDEMAARFARWPQRGGQRGPAGQGDRVPAVADRPRPAAVPVPGRARRDELPARAHLRRRGRAVRRQAARGQGATR